MTETAETTLLSIQNLVTVFNTDRGQLRAVDDVSFDIGAGERVGLVGESGSGKTMTALSILRLVEPGRIASGRVLLRDIDLLELSEADMRRVRGGRISMIFQEPMTALNPVFTVGAQIIEAMRAHRKMSKDEAKRHTVDMLHRVGVEPARGQVDAYPHELSGGMRQRVMIAMALCTKPELVLADEPTTALDVTTQAQILTLFEERRRELGTAALFITHDMSVLARAVDTVVVMYAGQVVEKAPVHELFSSARHPYTQGLIAAARELAGARVGERLTALEGRAPDVLSLGPLCRFCNRCNQAITECSDREPTMVQVGHRHFVRCVRAHQGEAR